MKRTTSTQTITSTEKIILSFLLVIILALVCIIVYLNFPEAIPSTVEKPTAKPANLPYALPHTLVVNNFSFTITRVASYPGVNASTKNIVILGNAQNIGQSSDAFYTYFMVELRAGGMSYKDDLAAFHNSADRYGTERRFAGFNPGEIRYMNITFIVPSTVKEFTLVPGESVTSWSGDVPLLAP